MDNKEGMGIELEPIRERPIIGEIKILPNGGVVFTNEPQVKLTPPTKDTRRHNGGKPPWKR